MWQVGSLGNASPLILISHNVNLIKGMLFDFHRDDNGVFTGKLRRSLMNSDDFDKYLSAALSAGGKGIEVCFEPIRNVSSTAALSQLPRYGIFVRNLQLTCPHLLGHGRAEYSLSV